MTAKSAAQGKWLVIAMLVVALLPTHSQAQQLPSAGFDELAQRAGNAREQGDIDNAITLYAQAVQLNPSWQDGWWYLGSLQYGAGAS
jgi:hypothetical protein